MFKAFKFLFFILILFICFRANAETYTLGRVVTDETDCTSITTGKYVDVCKELDDPNALYSCVPDEGTGGTCDTPSEWKKVSGQITAVGTCDSGDCFVDGTNHQLIFEGALVDNFEISLSVAEPTQDRSIVFPDISGTVALTNGVSEVGNCPEYDSSGRLIDSGIPCEQVTGGDIIGPSSSTDNTFPRFDSTTGKIIQGGQTVEDDSGNITVIGSVTAPSFVATTSGLSVLTQGITINNDGGATTNSDTTIKTDNLTAVFIDASSDSVTGLGSWDLGGASDFEIPNSAAPTVDTTGQIALDTTITGHDGFLTYYDGSNAMTVLAVQTSNLGTTDNYIFKYDSGTSTIKMEPDSGTGSGYDGTDDLELNGYMIESSDNGIRFDPDDDSDADIVISSTGNLGIGTSDPQAAIEVFASDGKIKNLSNGMFLDLSTVDTIILGMTSGTYNEDISFNLDSSSNVVTVDSSTGVDLVDFGENIVVSGLESECKVIQSPTGSTNLLLKYAYRAMTIKSIKGIVDPEGTGESVVIALFESDSNGDFSSLSTNGIDGTTTITADNDGANDDGSLSNPSLDIGDWLGINIGTVTGTVSELTVCYEYTNQ